jgi:hypothetical protein
MARFPVAIALAASCWAWVALCPLATQGQTWDYSPCNVRLFVACERTVDLPPALGQSLEASLARGLRIAGGPAWRIFPAALPQAGEAELVERFDAVTLKSLQAFEPQVLQIVPDPASRYFVAATGDSEQLAADKLLLVVVREASDGWHVRGREFDVATQQWSDVIERKTLQPAALPEVTLDLAARCIRPLAKVEKVDGRSIVARVRAGGLASADSRATLRPGSITVPIVRRNARNGEALPGGIYAPQWSYVVIEETRELGFAGKLHSGYGSVIPVKGGPRTERLLLGIEPQHTATTLELRARVPAPKAGAKPVIGRPLAGYEIYAKKLGAENTELMGLTDGFGKIELVPDADPLKLFYIKNGGQMLARLPLLVGQHSSTVANVLDDDPRLLTEAYVKALQYRVMDLVARREILAVRIRAKLKKGDYKAARQLLAEFRALPGSSQLMRELEETQRRMGTTTGVTGQRIERLFAEGRKLLQSFLPPAAAEDLAREIAEAERKGPPKSTDDSPETPPETRPAA